MSENSLNVPYEQYLPEAENNWLQSITTSIFFDSK